MISLRESTRYRREEDRESDWFDEHTLERANSRNGFQGMILRIRNVFNYPLKRLREEVDDEYIKGLTQNDGFGEFEARLRPYTAGLCPEDYSSTKSYIFALLLLDQLDASLRETETKLPDKIRALDVGCGRKWSYAEALYGFFQYYDAEQPRDVTLDGIDLLLKPRNIARLNKRIGDRAINPTQGDVLKMDADSEYDFILLRTMLTSEGHFKMYGLEPTNLDIMMDKCSQLLTPNGIQVTIGYESAGEYMYVVEHIPTERRVAEFDYGVELGNTTLNFEVTPGEDPEEHSGICVSRKG